MTVTGATNTIGSTDGLTFRSISANGGANGIVLNNTGTGGGLTVTGNGGICTDANQSGCDGGTIAGMTGADDSGATPAGAGIVLNNTRVVSLSRMWVHDHSNYGVRGTSVVGFTLNNSVFSGVNGTNSNGPFNDSSVYFLELTGTVSVANTCLGRLVHPQQNPGTHTEGLPENLAGRSKRPGQRPYSSPWKR